MAHESLHATPTLRPVLDVTPELRVYLDRKKLRQQYWYEWFAELIIGGLWDDLANTD
ncbi:MAG TPA: hypothetical protein VKO41_08600 [Gaiellaceae bacterium]|nr:hypothetical protein [Gaiellaceae bacterium]